MGTWERAARLRPDVSPAAARALSCEVRTLETVAELIESYRLRYEVYGALGYLRYHNESKLEIDEYDLQSIPFGAFDPMTGEMIGTLRLVTTEAQADYQGLVQRVIADLDDAELAEQALTQRGPQLPSIVSEVVAQQIDAFNVDHFPVCELSRSIVRPDCRGAGVSRALMELGLAHAGRTRPAVIVGGCLPSHVAMYARYGYQTLPETGLEHFDSVGQIAHALICRTDVMPEPTRTHIDELLHAYRSGEMERTLELGRGLRALYRFATPRRARRRTQEW